MVTHVVLEHTHLLYGRHLDQVLLSALYGVAKVHALRQVTFKDIIAHYKRQPQARTPVFRTVAITLTDPDLQAHAPGCSASRGLTPPTLDKSSRSRSGVLAIACAQTCTSLRCGVGQAVHPCWSMLQRRACMPGTAGLPAPCLGLSRAAKRAGGQDRRRDRVLQRGVHPSGQGVCAAPGQRQGRARARAHAVGAQHAVARGRVWRWPRAPPIRHAPARRARRRRAGRAGRRGGGGQVCVARARLPGVHLAAAPVAAAGAAWAYVRHSCV